MLSLPTVVMFGVVMGLFLGFILGLVWGPAAPLALTIPLGFYVIIRTADEARKGPPIR